MAGAGFGRDTIAPLLSLVKFVGWSLGAVRPEAWSTPGVLACAERWATGRRRIAEIGVWQGAVTCRLRAVMAVDGIIFAVDPYPPGRLGIRYQEIIAKREVAKIARGTVVWVRDTGRQAVRHPQVAGTTFDFVFVDADHSIEGLTENWEAWAPLVAPNGLLALHETGVAGGLSAHGHRRFCDTVAREDKRFEMIDAVEHLLVLRRRCQ